MRRGRTRVRCPADGPRAIDATHGPSSALAMSVSSPNVTRWWVDLGSYNKDHWVMSLHGLSDRDHSKIFEVPELRTFIKDNILTQTATTLPTYLSSSVPPSDNIKRLRFFLHSPLTLSAHDQNGNEISADNSTIPGAMYKQYGEVQSISLPASIAPTITLNGYEAGSFSLEIQEVTGNTVTGTATFTGVPSSPNTVATMSFPDGTIIGASSLLVDENGDVKINILKL